MDELDRLFHLVVRMVRDTRPEFLSRPFEVGELIAFVPYRSARSEIGADTNDDYSHIVTRLLSGERGYLFADDLMQDDLRAELAGPNPDLAAYRSYLNAHVSLSQEHARQALDAMGPATSVPAAETDAPAPATAAPAQPRTAAVPPRPVASPAPPPPRPLDPAAAAPRRVGRPGCRYCGQHLPEGREVVFCPHCGQNLLARRCAACSAELEPAWKFCVACGRAAAP
jgi:predicted RNA-binding Zn-ribbon protein involved in translation (DUF1610 family)